MACDVLGQVEGDSVFPDKESISRKLFQKTVQTAECRPPGQGLRAITRGLELRTEKVTGKMGKKWTENVRTATMGLRLGPGLPAHHRVGSNWAQPGSETGFH